MNIILSMCGKGKRFLEQGIHLPKFLCAYNGAPMIYHTVETLGMKGRIHFIVKQEHLIDYPYLEKMLLTLGDEIVILKDDTEGAAQSLLAAESFIQNKQHPMVSVNCDQFMNWDGKSFQTTIEKNPETSYIVTFETNKDNCSYVKKENGKVVEVREKQVISNEATVGIYHWAKTEWFLRDAKQMIQDGMKDNGEYYVAPVYNYTIQQGNNVDTYMLKPGEFNPVGTPAEFITFNTNNKFFS